jgi:hypothetical protein
MPEAECLEILGQHSLGRVAVVVEGRPQIFPVNYGIRGRVIAFRTAAGTKLAHAPGSHVAFEIDGYDESTGVGWSVMVQGIGRDVTDAGDDFSWTARGVPAYPLAPGTRSHRIAVDPTSITGRRFRGSS